MFTPQNRSRRLLALASIAFALRLVVAISRGIGAAPAEGSDQFEYDNYAWNLAQGRGYRGISADVADREHLTAYRPPATSVVWAGLYRVFGHRYDVVRIAHCLFGAASVLAVYGIARRCFDDDVALWAAGALAIHPPSLHMSTELLSEPLATVLFLLFILATLHFAARPRWFLAMGAGTLLGLCMLTRPAFVLMLPLFVAWAVWQFRGQLRTMASALIVPLVAVLALVPWTIRNYLIFHTFIPFATLGGSALLGGNNRLVVTDPTLFGYSVWDTTIPEYRDALQNAGDEVTRDRLARQFAVQWLKENPDRWAFMLQAKFRRSWSPILQPTSPWHYRWGMLLSWGPVVTIFALSAVPTLVHFLRQRHPGWIVHLGVLHFVVLSAIFFGDARYRQPVEGLCMIVAAGGVWLVVAALRRTRAVAAAPAAA